MHENKVRVHSENTEEDIPRLVTLIHEKGGAVRSLNVTKPTLEDVFLRLTGRGLNI